MLLLLIACVQTPDAPVPLAVTAGADVVAYVGEPVTLPGTVAGAARQEWSFGDGATSADPTHSYAAPGHYTAVLSAWDAAGRDLTDALRVTVVYPPLDAAPRSSTTALSDAGRVLAVLPDHGLVAVVGPGGVHHLAPCARPARLSAAAGLLAVVCVDEAPAIVTYELLTLHERARLDLAGAGQEPLTVVVTDEGEVLVTLRQRAAEAGLVWRLDADLQEREEHTLGRDLRGLAVQGRDALLVRHRSPDAGGEAWRWDLDADTFTPSALPPAPGPDSDTGSRGVPSYLQAVALRPDGREAAIAGLRANIARGLVRDGQPLTDETTTRAELRALSLADGSEVGRARLDNRDLVRAVAYNPLGDQLALAMGGMEVVDLFDAFTLEHTATVFDVGHAPDAVWFSEDGLTLYVHAALSRQVGAWDLRDLSAPARVETFDLLPPSGEVLPPDVLLGAQIFHAAADRRMSRDGYASCASCHLDGEDDGRTWDFTDRGEGLRNTASLRGMALRTGPIHWSANFDEVQDFEADIRGPQAGSGFLADDLWAGPHGPSLGEPKAGLSPELDALAAYVGSLRPAAVPWDVDVDEGAALFTDLGCAVCHPDGGTDSRWLAPGEPLLHDVGTLTPASGQRLRGPLTGLDTPDLRGVWDTPPYLHDGSAATLREVLVTRNAEGLHGDLQHLTEPQLVALERYLRSL